MTDSPWANPTVLPTNPAQTAAPETTSDATATDTPIVSDANIMKAAAVMDLTEAMVSAARNISEDAATIRFAAEALARYLEDDSISKAAEDMIMRAASTRANDAISRATGINLDAFSPKTSG